MANSELDEAHGLYTAEGFLFIPEEPLTESDVKSGAGFLCGHCDYQHCSHHRCPEFSLPPRIRREKWCIHNDCCFRRLRLRFCYECIHKISSITVMHNAPYTSEDMLPFPQHGGDSQEFCYMKTFREIDENTIR